MVRRMAQPQQIGATPRMTRTRLAAALAAVLLSGTAGGAAEQAAVPAADDPALSQECRVPGAQLYTVAQLGARTPP